MKGRKGLPNCAHWLLCVRPAGYYPDAPPKKPKPPARERSEGGGSDKGISPEDYERGVKFAYASAGQAEAKLYYARQVRRRARRLELAYGETNPRLAKLVVAEAMTISRAVHSSVHKFYEMHYRGSAPARVRP